MFSLRKKEIQCCSWEFWKTECEHPIPLAVRVKSRAVIPLHAGDFTRNIRFQLIRIDKGMIYTSLDNMINRNPSHNMISNSNLYNKWRLISFCILQRRDGVILLPGNLSTLITPATYNSSHPSHKLKLKEILNSNQTWRGIITSPFVAIIGIKE